MSQVNISYKTAKALKEFLGESAPEPMDKYWYYEGESGNIYMTRSELVVGKTPAYQLHDLLSKTFCEAFSDMTEDMGVWEVSESLNMEYFNGGLPAVEKALTEMMEGK